MPPTVRNRSEPFVATVTNWGSKETLFQSHWFGIWNWTSMPMITGTHFAYYTPRGHRSRVPLECFENYWFQFQKVSSRPFVSAPFGPTPRPGPSACGSELDLGEYSETASGRVGQPRFRSVCRCLNGKCLPHITFSQRHAITGRYWDKKAVPEARNGPPGWWWRWWNHLLWHRVHGTCYTTPIWHRRPADRPAIKKVNFYCMFTHKFTTILTYSINKAIKRWSRTRYWIKQRLSFRYQRTNGK